MRLELKDWNLNAAERLICVEALATAGSIVEAAKLLGITRHALKRRIIKHNIEWPMATEETETAEVVALAVEAERTTLPAASVPKKAEWLFTTLESFLPARMRGEDLGDAREHIAKMVNAGVNPARVWVQVLLVAWWTLLKIVKGPVKPHK